MKMRPYQQQAHDDCVTWVKRNTASCVLELPTGAGKSIIVAEIASTLNKISKGKHVLCIVPSKELLEQNADKIRATGNEVSLFSASVGETCLANPLVVGTPVSIKNQLERFGSQFCAVIIDECFTGETMVLTENGEKRIDEIKVGEVLCNAIGRGIVRSIFSKTSSTIILELSNGTKIECTGDHPIFTEKGFVEAKRLENGTRLYSKEDVRILWESFSAKTNDFKKRKDCCKHFGITLEQARVLFNVLLKEKEKSNGFVRKQRENAFKAKRKTPCPNDAWRERSVTKHSTTCTMARTWKRMGNGIVGCDKKRSFKWNLSKSLQNRYCKQGIDDCNRGGREFTLPNKKTVRRFEKTNSFKGAGLVSLSSIKQGCDRVVFNLRVSGHPSYFANGFLVHNCHKITPTVKEIIDQLQVFNERLRVIGLSATPYRMNTGYIYKHDLRGVALHESKTREPYFHKLIYKITARDLIQQGYLCQPIVGAIHSEHYETLNMQTNSMGNFSKEDIDRAYHGKGRLTADIVADVINQSKNRQGVLFFAATVQHAGEIMESLPPELSAIVTGSTSASQREIILLKFKAKIIKYLVNVAVLTTGFDAPHCDVVAILRATESASLLQQIIGRGLRLSNGKENCLVLDYAENIERHCPDGDVFNPNIKTINSSDFEGEYLVARCEKCATLNEFKPRDNDAGFGIDDNGYFVDLQNNRIETEHGFFPAHYGRACQSDYCDYKWSFKPCHECGEGNDITARYCRSCKEELIDPNEKLVREHRKRKSDPYLMQTDDVLDMKITPTVSKAGNECLRVDFTTPWRTFVVFFTPKFARDYNGFIAVTRNGKETPNTITYQKVGDFYRIYNYNARPLKDEIPPLA